AALANASGRPQHGAHAARAHGGKGLDHASRGGPDLPLLGGPTSAGHHRAEGPGDRRNGLRRIRGSPGHRAARLPRTGSRRAEADPSDARPGPSHQEKGGSVMSTLLDWYPGDRAIDFFLIVALGVTLLSGAAWVVSRRLPRRPATRH